MDYSSWRNHGCRLFSFVHKGYQFLTLENNLLKVTVLVDKGADIYEIIYKPMDIDFIWKSPNRLREANKYIPTAYNDECTYLDNYYGGFQELLPAGGPASYKGCQLGLHGEVSTIPWSYKVIEDTKDLVEVEFECFAVRTPFHIKKRLSLKHDSLALGFKEWLTNEGEEKLEFLWAQHPSFGSPFLDDCCRLDIPAEEFSTSDFFNSPTAHFEPEFSGKWPKALSKNNELIDLSLMPKAGKPCSDIYYLRGLKEGWFALTNTRLKLGIGFCFELDVFPYITYWQACNGNLGYPWYGRTYNISVELWNSYTDRIRTAKANGTIRHIAAGETIATSFKAIVYTGLESVKQISFDEEVK